MKIFFVADQTPTASQALRACIKKYGQADLEKADVVIALGGDGFMLKILQQLLNYKIPVFGFNFGHVGHLLNKYDPAKELTELVEMAEKRKITPLAVNAEPFVGKPIQAHVFNDVSFTRQSPQAARLSTIVTDEKDFKSVVMQETVFGDGLIVATGSGSSGYYASAGGKAFCKDASSIGVKSINCKVNFNPIVSDKAHICVAPQEALKRPIQMDCDGQTRFSNIAAACVQSDLAKSQTLLFERRINER